MTAPAITSTTLRKQVKKIINYKMLRNIKFKSEICQKNFIRSLEKSIWGTLPYDLPITKEAV